MSDHKSATPDIDTQIESLLDKYSSALTIGEGDRSELLRVISIQTATQAIKTLLIQSKIDELERLIHPGWSGKIPENAATMLISHHDVEKQLAKLKEELEP